MFVLDSFICAYIENFVIISVLTLFISILSFFLISILHVFIFLPFTSNNYIFTSIDAFKYTFSSIFIIEIVFTLICLPFILRLSGQLLVQTLKYRITIQNYVNADQYVPYYEHYRIIFCLFFALMLFAVFNLIKALHLLKAIFLITVEPISLNIVLNLWISLQDAILSFGLIVMLQIIYFFQEKTFNFGSYLLLAILRFFWVFFVESSLFILLIMYISSSAIFYQDFGSYATFFAELAHILKVFLVFRFAKEANDLAKRLIGGILGDNNLRQVMGHERVENIYRATVLFRSLSWGDFIIVFLALIPSTLDFLNFFGLIDPSILYPSLSDIHSYIVLKLYQNVYPYFSNILVSEIVHLLSGILYSAFLFILWKMFSTKNVKYSGYSHFNQEKEFINIQDRTDETIPLLTALHFTGSKMQKILMRYYSPVITGITIVTIAFITPLFITGWNSIVVVPSGDFYMLSQTNLYKAMSSCSKVTVDTQLQNSISFNCTNVFFASLGENATYTYHNYSMEFNVHKIFGSHTLWTPKNTIIAGLDNFSSLKVPFITESNFPCFSSFENFIGTLYTAVNFDCDISNNRVRKLLSNCSTDILCKSFQYTIPNPSMIDLTYTSNRSPVTSHLIKKKYTISSLLNVIPVDQISTSKSDFDWEKYDVIVRDDSYVRLIQRESCIINFTCTFSRLYASLIIIFTLFFMPGYLIMSLFLRPLCVRSHLVGAWGC